MRLFRADTDRAAWRFVDGEAVIVHADTSAYYGLNSSATFIWQSILDCGLGAGELGERVGARFGVENHSILGEVEAFLASLAAEGLVTEVDGSSDDATSTAVSDQTLPGSSYEPPKLERFGDLEQLVLSGE